MLDPKNFSEEIKSEQATLVEFGAEWCMPCKMMKPILADLSKTYRVIEIDYEDFPKETTEYKISSVPALLFFKSGKLVKRISGAQTKETIKKAFEDLEK